MRKLKTLKKNYEFKNVLTKGIYYRGNYITVYIMKNRQNENTIGIAIGKKLGKAVKRNRIKRVIRESYRLYKDQLQKGYSFVFLWNKQNSIEQCCYQNVKKDMEKLFKKAKVLL